MARWSAVLSFALLLAAACSGSGGAAGSTGPRVAEPGAEDLTCSRDQDCILVNDCCGCEAGGTRVAVRADRAQPLSEAAEQSCASRTCRPTTTQHRSCSATAARCAGGRCIPAI